MFEFFYFFLITYIPKLRMSYFSECTRTIACLSGMPCDRETATVPLAIQIKYFNILAKGFKAAALGRILRCV